MFELLQTLVLEQRSERKQSTGFCGEFRDRISDAKEMGKTELEICISGRELDISDQIKSEIESWSNFRVTFRRHNNSYIVMTISW